MLFAKNKPAHLIRILCLALSAALIPASLSGCARRASKAAFTSQIIGSSAVSQIGSGTPSGSASGAASAASKSASAAKPAATVDVDAATQKQSDGTYTTSYGILPFKPYTEVTAPGTHSPEVYLGSSSDRDEQSDNPDQWSYVRQNADGFYANFINMWDYNLLTLKDLAQAFSNKHAYYESDNKQNTIEKDQDAIIELQEAGFIVPYTSLNYGWSAEHQNNLKTYNLLSGQKSRLCLTQSGPWCCGGDIKSEGANGDFTNAAYRSWIKQSDGMSTDGPLGYWLVDQGQMQEGSYSLVKYAHSLGKKAAVMVCPYGANISSYNTNQFLSVGESCVRAHEDNDAEPDIWIDYEYATTFKSIPESKNGAPANTVTGMAYYLLKHIKGDPGTLDLYATSGSTTAGKNQFSANVSKTNQKLVLKASAPVGTTCHVSLNAADTSSWLDYAAVLKASGTVSGWNISFKIGGQDISGSVEGKGFEFYKGNRLNPKTTRTVDVTFTRTAGTGAMTMNLQLLPHFTSAASDTMQILAK